MIWIGSSMLVFLYKIYACWNLLFSQNLSFDIVVGCTGKKWHTKCLPRVGICQNSAPPLALKVNPWFLRISNHLKVYIFLFVIQNLEMNSCWKVFWKNFVIGWTTNLGLIVLCVNNILMQFPSGVGLFDTSNAIIVGLGNNVND